MYTPMRDEEFAVHHEHNLGIIAHGESIENCFENTARVLFSLVTDIDNIHSIQIITMEFEETDNERALFLWLSLLLQKCKELQIIFGDFRLRREGNVWKATVSGEPFRHEILHGIEVKDLEPAELSVKKENHVWEARCVVDV